MCVLVESLTPVKALPDRATLPGYFSGVLSGSALCGEMRGNAGHANRFGKSAVNFDKLAANIAEN